MILSVHEQSRGCSVVESSTKNYREVFEHFPSSMKLNWLALREIYTTSLPLHSHRIIWATHGSLAGTTASRRVPSTLLLQIYLSSCWILSSASISKGAVAYYCVNQFSPQKDFSKLLFAEQWPGLLVAALFSLICKINAIHASGNEFWDGIKIFIFGNENWKTQPVEGTFFNFEFFFNVLTLAVLYFDTWGFKNSE